MKLGVIGLGNVGQAVYNGLKPHYEVTGFDTKLNSDPKERLLDADMVLGPLYSILEKMTKHTKVTRWIAEPLFKCAYCNAGQVSLWSYLGIYSEYPYNPFLHIGFVSLTILTTHIIIKKIGKY